jgi:hypothetical protein
MYTTKQLPSSHVIGNFSGGSHYNIPQPENNYPINQFNGLSSNYHQMSMQYPSPYQNPNLSTSQAASMYNPNPSQHQMGSNIYSLE